MDASNASSLAFRFDVRAASLCAASRSWFTKARRLPPRPRCRRNACPTSPRPGVCVEKHSFVLFSRSFHLRDERGTCERFSCPPRKKREPTACLGARHSRSRADASANFSHRAPVRVIFRPDLRPGGFRPERGEGRLSHGGLASGFVASDQASAAIFRGRVRERRPDGLCHPTPRQEDALSRGMTRSRARRAIRAGTPSPPSPSTPGGATRAVPRVPDGTIEPRRRRPSQPRTTSRTTRLWTETAKAPRLPCAGHSSGSSGGRQHAGKKNASRRLNTHRNERLRVETRAAGTRGPRGGRGGPRGAASARRPATTPSP